MTTTRYARLTLAGFAAMFIGACAALPDDAPVVENLDEETGVTIARLGRPLELYNETSSKDVAERFAFLGPFETNQMGKRELFLWVALPMENPGGSPAPTVLSQWRGARHSARQEAARNSPAFAQFALPDPHAVDRELLLPHRRDIVARLGAATDLRIEVRATRPKATGRSRICATALQPGDDRRLRATSPPLLTTRRGPRRAA